jgi:hypothetical protein
VFEDIDIRERLAGIKDARIALGKSVLQLLVLFRDLFCVVHIHRSAIFPGNIFEIVNGKGRHFSV